VGTPACQRCPSRRHQRCHRMRGGSLRLWTAVALRSGRRRIRGRRGRSGPRSAIPGVS
jgi:hypothetical protein